MTRENFSILLHWDCLILRVTIPFQYKKPEISSCGSPYTCIEFISFIFFIIWYVFDAFYNMQNKCECGWQQWMKISKSVRNVILKNSLRLVTCSLYS